MLSSKSLRIFILLAPALIAAPEQVASQPRTSLSCSQATMVKAGVGVPYSGDVSIDDYRLRARIPQGLTGWGGVAPDAPFHGFTIFLDSSMRDCIVFEIHLRIDDDGAPVRPHTARVLSLGNAKAWQTVSSGSNRAKGPVNLVTYFAAKQNGQIDDGQILLVSRPEQLPKTRLLYDIFLKSVTLGAAHSP